MAGRAWCARASSTAARRRRRCRRSSATRARRSSSSRICSTSRASSPASSRSSRKRVSASDVVRTAVDAMMPTGGAQGRQPRRRLRADALPHRRRSDAPVDRWCGTWWPTRIKFTPAGGRVEVVVGSVDDLRRDRGHRQRQRHRARVPAARLRGLPPGRRLADAQPRRPRARPRHRQAHRRAPQRFRRSSLRGFGSRRALHRALAAGSSGGGCHGRRLACAYHRLVPSACTSSRDVRVLVVDDDEDSREMLTMVFEQHGAAVERAASTAEAIAAIARRRPHILLSDVGMPGEDGHALIRRVRESERTSGECRCRRSRSPATRPRRTARARAKPASRCTSPSPSIRPSCSCSSDGCSRTPERPPR